MFKKLIFLLLISLLASSAWSEKLTTKPTQEEKLHDRSKIKGLFDREQIKKFPTLVKRENDTLILALDGSKEKRLKDGPGPRNKNVWVYYVFKDYFPLVGYFLIQYIYNEGGAYLLFNRKNGSMTRLEDIPIFSPDKNYFITVSICDAYCDRGLRIWKISETGLEQDWSMVPDEYWAYGKAEWTGKHLIKITKNVKKDPADPRTKYIDKNFYIRRVSGKWKVLKNTK